MQRAVIGTNADDVVDACEHEGIMVPRYTLELSARSDADRRECVAIVAFAEFPTYEFAMACLEYVVSGALWRGEISVFTPGLRGRLQRLMPLH